MRTPPEVPSARTGRHPFRGPGGSGLLAQGETGRFRGVRRVLMPRRTDCPANGGRVCRPPTKGASGTSRAGGAPRWAGASFPRRPDMSVYVPARHAGPCLGGGCCPVSLTGWLRRSGHRARDTSRSRSFRAPAGRDTVAPGCMPEGVGVGVGVQGAATTPASSTGISPSCPSRMCSTSRDSSSSENGLGSRVADSSSGSAPSMPPSA